MANKGCYSERKMKRRLTARVKAHEDHKRGDTSKVNGHTTQHRPGSNKK